MPIARRAERTQTLRPLPNIRRTAAETPESMGYGVEQAKARKYLTIGQTFGHAADSVTNTIGKIVKEEQAKAHDKMMLDAGNRLSAFEREYYYGQNGVLRKLGDQANTSPEEFFAAYRQAEAEIRSGLATDDQRFEFDKMSARQFDTMDVTIRRHVLTQQNNALETSLKASTANSVNKAIGARLDPAKADEYMAEMEANMRRTMPKLGIPQDAIDAAVLEQRSAIHEGIVNGYLGDGQDMQARAYLEVMGHEIQEDRVDDLKQRVEAGSTQAEAQRQFDRIWAEGGSITDKRAKAREIPDAKVRQDTLTLLEHENEFEARQKRQAIEETSLQFANALEANGGRLSAVQQRYRQQWEALPISERNEIEALAKSIRTGDPIPTDDNALAFLVTMSEVSPQEFARINPMTYRAKLSKADWEQMVRKRASILSGDTKAASMMFATEGTQTQIINEALTKMGLPVTQAQERENPEQAERTRNFRRAVRQTAQQLELKPGDVQGLQKVVDQLIITRSITPGGWWRDETKTFLFEVDLSTIPKSYLDKIDEQLIERGMPLTRENRLDMYRTIQVLEAP